MFYRLKVLMSGASDSQH